MVTEPMGAAGYHVPATRTEGNATMTKNIGNAERIIRAVVGVILLIAALTGGWGGLWTTIGVIVGLVLLGTAAMGYCPPYQLLGINTCKKPGA